MITLSSVCKTFVLGGLITLFHCSIPLTRFTSYHHTRETLSSVISPPKTKVLHKENESFSQRDSSLTDSVSTVDFGCYGDNMTVMDDQLWIPRGQEEDTPPQVSINGSTWPNRVQWYRTGPHIYHTYGEKNWFFFVPFRPLSPLSSTLLPPGQNLFFSYKKKPGCPKNRGKHEKCLHHLQWRSPDLCRPDQRTTIHQ